WTSMPHWRRWPDDDQRRWAPAGARAAPGVAGQDRVGRPGDAGGPTGEVGAGVRRRGPAGDLDSRRQGGPGDADPAGAVAPRRAGAARGAANPHVAAALGPADGPDAGELRLRLPAGDPAVQAGDAGDLLLAAGEAGAVDPGTAGRGEDASGDRTGSPGGGVGFLGGVLPAGRAAA